MSTSEALKSAYKSLMAASTPTPTTSASAGGPSSWSNTLQGLSTQPSQFYTTGGTGGLGNLGGQNVGYYQPTTTSTFPYPGYPAVPPTLPIKLDIREMCKLMQALDADEELRNIIKKFQPFIGVEI